MEFIFLSMELALFPLPLERLNYIFKALHTTKERKRARYKAPGFQEWHSIKHVIISD